MRFLGAALLFCFAASFSSAADSLRMLPPSTGTVNETQTSYYWKNIPVGGNAEILTLFLGACESTTNTAECPSDYSVPLLSVLRDNLGERHPENDRLSYVWLLTYSKPNIGKRVLGAVPFFYWRVGDARVRDIGSLAPLMNLNTPDQSLVSGIGRQVVQWAALDPMTAAVRASSRAYQSNDSDHERVHLEEAISYLRSAPLQSDIGLTETERNTVIARLELRKRLLGGLVNNAHAAEFGREDNFEQERVRSRNWEMLRQCAERTGLIFEPLNLAGTTGQYAALWYPLNTQPEPTGAPVEPVFKLLNIKNPWNDRRLQEWEGPIVERPLEESITHRTVRLVPLGIYNMNYPKLPLLMIDFRDKLHLRRHEMTQRTINEITAGVIGISHFTNWYYYVAADVYTFVVGRHGSAMDKAARLDCYAQFRTALALDQEVDPALKKQMNLHADSLDVNPLESAPGREIEAAARRYELLMQEAANGPLEARINRDRRAELASSQESPKKRASDLTLHELSLGMYTHRSHENAETVALLDRYRRIQFNLAFLDSLVAAATPPEVAYQSSRIQASVQELGQLIQGVRSADLRKHTAATLAELRDISKNGDLRSDCSSEIAALQKSSMGPLRVGVAAQVLHATELAK